MEKQLPKNQPLMPDDTIPNNQLPITNYLLLTLVLSIFAIAPLFYPGYIQTHTGFVPLWNVADLRANLGQEGWMPHIGLNFDPLRSDGLLPYYLAALLPLEPATAVKVVLGLSWLLGSAGMFFWLKDELGESGAVAAALVYTYLPFHIATVYVRGAWGEALFWGLLTWGFTIYNLQFTIGRIFLTFLLWLVLGLSQMGLTLWAFVLLTLWLLVRRRRRGVWPVVAALLGILAAITIVFLASSPHSPSPHNFVDHFLYPSQLFSAFWGTGFSRAGWNDGLSFQLGLAATGLTFLSMILFVGNSLHEKDKAVEQSLWDNTNKENVIARPQGLSNPPPRKETASPAARSDIHQTILTGVAAKNYFFWLGSVIILILLQFPLSQLLWQLPIFPGFTLADTLTYPWQLLGLAGLGLSVLAGIAWRLDPQLTRLPIFGAIIIFIILSSYSYLNPQFFPLTPEMKSGPQAQLGNAQVAVLSHNFSVESSGQTAGLLTQAVAIPLEVYGLPHANQTLRLNVTWQPLQPLNEDLKVFAHLVDAQNKVLGQFDGQPQQGIYLTSDWIPGELIEDSYPLTFPADTPPGPYRVYLGLYNETTGARLPVPGDPEGRVMWDVE